ncbi:MAG: hypothetical protein IPO81_22670 [Kouleothrix sp.]|nr:hypothetical protein [Kouleothrix sp.]
MSDQHDKQPPAPIERRVLGKIPDEPRDSELSVNPQPSPASHRRPAPPPPSADDPEQLTLPRGALVAMRKSGGLSFSSREIVVFRDGRVAYRRSGAAGHAPAGEPTRLTAAQLDDLLAALRAVDFARLAPAAGGQPPDRFAYEIVARPRRRIKVAEVFDGSIPETVAPLIRQLRALMPE